MSDGRIQITQQSPSNPAGRLVDRGHFDHRIPKTELSIHSWAHWMQTNKHIVHL